MEKIVFSVRPTKVQNSVAIFSYALPDDRGVCRLLAVSWNKEASSHFKQVSMSEAPVEITYSFGEVPMEMEMWKRAGCEVKDVSVIDMSFVKFWNSYGKKLGNKARVEKKWNALASHEKLLALGVVPRMQRYYAEKRLDLPYPETFIDQRRWENLFE